MGRGGADGRWAYTKTAGAGARATVRKGRSGNPACRRTGSSNKATIAALRCSRSEVLTRKAMDLALVGDQTAMRLCLERLERGRGQPAVANHEHRVAVHHAGWG
jgi:Family of unknown function (DUF5681)